METLVKDQALKVVLAALESKALTLGGPNNKSTSEGSAEADAAYIKTLIAALMGQ